MCILKIYSKTSSFKNFIKDSTLPVYSVFDKGEFRNKNKTGQCKEYSLSLDVSDRDWDEFPAQATDAIKFLSTHSTELERLFAKFNDLEGYLDFPLYSRLNGSIVNQNDHLPKELISLAGKLNLGIEMAIYATDIL